jgi:nicotinamidase-related amidase
MSLPATATLIVVDMQQAVDLPYWGPRCNPGAETVVFAGVAARDSVEATVRMADNLSFEAWIVADGCFTFDKTLLDGRVIPAADVHALSLANLAGEYARVVMSADLLQAVSAG